MTTNSIFSIIAAFTVLCQWGVSSAAAAAEARKIALLSDPHLILSTEAEPTSDAAPFRARFEKAIAEANAENVDLVLIAGDLANKGKKEEWAEFAQLIKTISAPTFYVPGNHDVGPKPNIKGSKDRISSSRYARYKAALGEGFWVQEVAGLRIIGVTGSLFGIGLPEEEAQWQMLEKELAAPATMPTILLSHYPLFAKTQDEPGGGYWNIEPEPRQRLRELIKSGGVCAVLSGHLHYPILYRIEDVVYAGAPAISFGVPRGKQWTGWALITIPAQGEIRAEWRFLPE